MSKESNKTPKVGDEYQIPVEGSLGLFALGYKGVTAWRKVRDAAKEKEKEKSNDKKEK